MNKLKIFHWLNSHENWLTLRTKRFKSIYNMKRPQSHCVLCAWANEHLFARSHSLFHDFSSDQVDEFRFIYIHLHRRHWTLLQRVSMINSVQWNCFKCRTISELAVLSSHLIVYLYTQVLVNLVLLKIDSLITYSNCIFYYFIFSFYFDVRSHI